MIIRCLWKRGNEKIWENTVRPVRFSISFALEFLVCWQHAKHPARVQEHQQPRPAAANNPAAGWVRPVVDFVKRNVDAALLPLSWIASSSR